MSETFTDFLNKKGIQAKYYVDEISRQVVYRIEGFDYSTSDLFSSRYSSLLREYTFRLNK